MKHTEFDLFHLANYVFFGRNKFFNFRAGPMVKKQNILC